MVKEELLVLYLVKNMIVNIMIGGITPPFWLDDVHSRA